MKGDEKMVQELVERYRQERRETEIYEQAYEEALEGLHRLSSFLLRDDRVVRNPGLAIVREELEVSVVDGGEKFKVTLFVLGRGMGVMAIVIEDSQGEINPVFYLNRSLKTVLGEIKFSQRLEVLGVSKGGLKKEDVWRLDDCNRQIYGLRPPELQEIQGYTRVLEQMKEALV